MTALAVPSAQAIMTAVANGRLMLPLIDLTRIGGNGACAQAEAIEAWAAQAEAGAECVYAIGHLPVWAKGPTAMRLLAERGLVHPYQDRAWTPKHYVARRLGRPWAGAVRPIQIVRRVACLTGLLGPLLELLTEAAEEGAPCPTNAALAAALGIEPRQAAYLMVCLVRAGSIAVALRAGPPFRIVTIVQRGISTGGRA
ncbi:hypothetical protein [Sphingomonas sp. YL-JM2C]